MIQVKWLVSKAQLYSPDCNKDGIVVVNDGNEDGCERERKKKKGYEREHKRKKE